MGISEREEQIRGYRGRRWGKQEKARTWPLHTYFTGGSPHLSPPPRQAYYVLYLPTTSFWRSVYYLLYLSSDCPICPICPIWPVPVGYPVDSLMIPGQLFYFYLVKHILYRAQPEPGDEPGAKGNYIHPLSQFSSTKLANCKKKLEPWSASTFSFPPLPFLCPNSLCSQSTNQDTCFIN